MPAGPTDALLQQSCMAALGARAVLCCAWPHWRACLNQMAAIHPSPWAGNYSNSVDTVPGMGE